MRRATQSSDTAYKAKIFLSTLSLRRATTLPRRFIRGSNNFYPRSPCGERRRPDKLQLPQNHFYPRSPCGERPALSLPFGAVWIISIHALLAESDVGAVLELQCVLDFYPRSPCGERRLFVCYMIHLLSYFYPRSPCGERRSKTLSRQPHSRFLSTLSLRRATAP